MDTIADSLTVPDLAARWHCSGQHVRRLIKGRVIAAVKVSARKTLIPISEVQAHEQRRTTKAAKRAA